MQPEGAIQAPIASYASVATVVDQFLVDIQGSLSLNLRNTQSRGM